MEAPTLYQVLGVPDTATAEEVRAAYRAAARTNHPDAGGDPRRMQQLNAAWRVLGHADRRAAYDRLLARRRAGNGAATVAGPPGATDGDGNGAGRSAEEWADLLDGQPLRPTMALEGWWAILPPGTLAAAVGLLFGAFFFRAPALLAFSAGAFVLALGLFVLAPLRAMTRRPDDGPDRRDRAERRGRDDRDGRRPG